jgi:LmbE family N-acetylglucosaminyl deacetylase
MLDLISFPPVPLWGQVRVELESVMSQSPRVLALFAHPDDAEFLCAGTLLLLADRGASIHLATATAGDCGSAILSAREISHLRLKEARRAAVVLGAQFSCLKEKDLLVFYDQPRLCKVMELVRRLDPSLVFTHSPSDYMLDHETTSRLCQTACFGATAPNFRSGVRNPAKPLRAIPHLYYTQPLGSTDILGKEVIPSLCVNIDAAMGRKELMLACHESQQAWLKSQQGVTGPSDTMRKMAARTGALVDFQWAEGFRQHLGQGFPQNDLLSTLLGEIVRRREV